MAAAAVVLSKLQAASHHGSRPDALPLGVFELVSDGLRLVGVGLLAVRGRGRRLLGALSLLFGPGCAAVLTAGFLFLRRWVKGRRCSHGRHHSAEGKDTNTFQFGDGEERR